MKPESALVGAALRAPGIAHAFFTREGGVSDGVYASLNGGVGSRDAPEAVAENRLRMAAALGVAPDALLIPYQTHSPDAVIVTGPFAERPRCDALVTATPGLAVGVTGADCGMILFAEPQARVVGAAHAGWRGALGGVLEATLEAMERLGARRERIVAALGPAIGAKSYEVGAEFYGAFVEADEGYAAFFTPGPGAEKFHFDLPRFIGFRLRAAGVGLFEDLARDTYAEPAHFFSYRRSVHLDEPDYGRLVSAIALLDPA
ncbi:peptidoglycan editing factor PgeF [Methylocella sp.]|uniref:peptidoglycan editing factor PgeF n=1 Tax=Methylocella sp. TaxID=1978226 RepID=UPI0035ADDA39